VKDWLASFFENGYTLFGRLKGHSGPINCISFRRDGTLVASGGKFVDGYICNNPSSQPTTRPCAYGMLQDRFAFKFYNVLLEDGARSLV
jgi:hypothetical protein